MTEQLGRYHLTEELGRGGMAVVYAGVAVGEEGFRKPVVVKRIHPHLTRERRFVDLLIREAKLTVRLEHPNVVQVLELGRVGDDYFIVLERVRGGDLGQLLGAARAAGVRFPPRLAGHVAREVLAALAYAHAVRDEDGSLLGVVHRDVSPSNVLVARDGRVRLTDFGIARTAFGGEATEGGLKGKLPYMSPEQARGEPVGPAGDLYSTGLVLFEMLSGRRALDGTDEMVLLADARRGARSVLEADPGAVPEDFHELLLRALSERPRDRFADARAMRGALAPLSHGLDAGQERLAELVALVLPDARPGTAPARAETRPPPTDTQTLVIRAGTGVPPSTPIVAPPAGPVARPGRRRWWVAVAMALLGVLATAVLALWQPWRGTETPAAGGQTTPPPDPGVAAAVEAAVPGEVGGGAPVVAGGEPAPSSTSPPPPDALAAVQTASGDLEPITANPAPAPSDPPPTTATVGAPGSLSVVVQGGTGLVHLDAPGWVDRYAPLSAVEVPAGRWTLTVHHADAGPMWSGVVDIPAGGTAGVLLEPVPGGGWKTTVR